MTTLISRRALIAAMAGLMASGQALAQSHSGGSGRGSGGRGGSGGGRGGSAGGGHTDGGHTDDGHSDGGHTDGDSHDHTDGDTDSHDHADRIDQGGKGKGPKYRGGRDVNAPSERAGHMLEDRVLRKE